MLRLLFFLLTFFGLTASALFAEDESGPLISITSPDTGTTFAFGKIKNHSLLWNEKEKMLSAEVTFVDEHQEEGQPIEDTHRFRLPGVILDEATGTFFATSAKGERVPVARRKKELFMKTIAVLPNAIVRISHRRGEISVILEAVRPGDLTAKPANATDPDGTHSVDIHQIVQ